MPLVKVREHVSDAFISILEVKFWPIALPHSYFQLATKAF